jgi:hypothetical protein
MKCSRGYFNKNGLCIKCIKGCSICSNNNTCDYCLSGYKLDNAKKCIQTNDFDFNITLYNYQKQEMIGKNEPEKNDSIFDPNCIEIYDSTGECVRCWYSFNLIGNKCKKKCSDPNCLDCTFTNTSEICNECKDKYNLINGSCFFHLKCFDNNCEECSDQFQYSCYNCSIKTLLYKGECLSYINGSCLICNGNGCYDCYESKKEQKDEEQEDEEQEDEEQEGQNDDKKNGISVLIIIFMCIGYFILFFCFITAAYFICKKCNECLDNMNNRNIEIRANVHQDNQRVIPYSTEFEEQLKQNTGNSQSQSIDFRCNICLENNINIAHFKCGCSCRVCKDCYIKCKTNNKRCPQCRKKI